MPHHINKETVLLIGAGPMAIDYAKVLKAQDVDFLVIGRSESSAAAFQEKTGTTPETGGLRAWLQQHIGPLPQRAIVATGVEALADTACLLLQYGIKNILLEKPGGRDSSEVQQVAAAAEQANALQTILLAYNRRFYTSVQQVKKMAAEDGGIASVHFEFTEWGHKIAPLQKAAGVKERWFLANSTHVADMAFYLAGEPKEMKSFTSGCCDWHPSATVFAGAGRTQRNALFSYQAHWEAPGRWSVEVITKKHRYYLKPLEEIYIQENGSVQVHKLEFDDAIDKQFKPGLYRQIAAWLEGDTAELCTIQKQAEMMRWYDQMANY